MAEDVAAPSVLLVEDSEDDLFFFQRLCMKAAIAAPIAIATDGQQAITYLGGAMQANGSAGVPLPRIVFLDLKLPLKSGFEVLEWIRAQPALGELVVVILSSSGEARDVTQAFALGAQGYLVKYPEPAVLAEVVRRIAALPRGVGPRELLLPGFLHST